MHRDPVCGMEIQESDAYVTREIDGAQVSFRSAACVARYDAEPQRFSPPLMRSPASQTVLAVGPASAIHGSAIRASSTALLSPIALGVLAALGLLAFYVGIITLAQGWAHALGQLTDDRWFVGAIALGFGTQVGLFTYLRQLHAHTAAGGVAASTGTSATAMLACCAHHLGDILPIVGVAGATAFLNMYKTPLLWLSIALNLAGVVYLLRKLRAQRHMSCHTALI